MSATVIVLLTDSQLAEEIEATEAEVCCNSLTSAARAGCGCRGVAGDYLARLRAEAVHRNDEREQS